jgi:DNA-binding phage protein
MEPMKKEDIAEHLNTPKEIRAFLQEVATTGDESDFIHALNTAARAMGMKWQKKQALPAQACTNL